MNQFSNSDSKILIVENNPANVLVASTLLETLGLQYDVAMSGDDAVKKVQDGFYPIIIIEMKVSNMDGEEAVRLIREHENTPESGRSKILCVTSGVLSWNRERCLSVGADDYMSKPYLLEELQDRLGRLLETKNA